MIKKILKTILPLIILLPLHAGSADWQVVSQMPVPVRGGQAIVHDSLIYIIGGYCDSLMECCNIIQEYNPKQNTWKILEDTLTLRRYGLAADNYLGKTVFYGGGCNNYRVNHADNYFGIEMWDFVSAPYNYNYNYNFNRTFSTANVYQDNLYIFGGYLSYFQGDTLPLPYIVEYNIPSSTVTYEKELYNYNLPYQQMSALIGENIYVFGGAHYGVSNEVHKFNVNNHSWQEQSTSMQKERAAGEAISISNSAIVIIGGYDESDQALSSTEIYNINGQSSFGAGLNYSRYELMAALYDSSIYVHF
jgi:N-acetylneuraminic acid mutarotase